MANPVLIKGIYYVNRRRTVQLGNYWMRISSQAARASRKGNSAPLALSSVGNGSLVTQSDKVTPGPTVMNENPLTTRGWTRSAHLVEIGIT